MAFVCKELCKRIPNIMFIALHGKIDYNTTALCHTCEYIISNKSLSIRCPCCHNMYRRNYRTKKANNKSINSESRCLNQYEKKSTIYETDLIVSA